MTALKPKSHNVSMGKDARQQALVPHHRAVHWDDGVHQTWVTTRAHMAQQAAPLMGPLMVIDYGSTILVPPGWWAEIQGAGHLLLHDRQRHQG